MQYSNSTGSLEPGGPACEVVSLPTLAGSGVSVYVRCMCDVGRDAKRGDSHSTTGTVVDRRESEYMLCEHYVTREVGVGRDV